MTERLRTNDAIELKPDYAEAYNNRGIVYIQSYYDRAIKGFNKAIEIKSDYAKPITIAVLFMPAEANLSKRLRILIRQ